MARLSAYCTLLITHTHRHSCCLFLRKQLAIGEPMCYQEWSGHQEHFLMTNVCVRKRPDRNGVGDVLHTTRNDRSRVTASAMCHRRFLYTGASFKYTHSSRRFGQAFLYSAISFMFCAMSTRSRRYICNLFRALLVLYWQHSPHGEYNKTFLIRTLLFRNLA